jgi:hypothetical protein
MTTSVGDGELEFVSQTCGENTADDLTFLESLNFDVMYVGSSKADIFCFFFVLHYLFFFHFPTLIKVIPARHKQRKDCDAKCDAYKFTEKHCKKKVAEQLGIKRHAKILQSVWNKNSAD